MVGLGSIKETEQAGKPVLQFSVIEVNGKSQMYSSGFLLKNGCLQLPMFRTGKGFYISTVGLSETAAREVYDILKEYIEVNGWKAKYPLAPIQTSIAKLHDVSKMCGQFPEMFLDSAGVE